MKKYYFLAGFPRSGNTVLSSILNQNPKIYCSPLSPISDILWNYDQSLQHSENLKINFNSNVIDIGKNILTEYYKDINKEIIIDREKGWAAVGNLQMIKKYINKNPKIIFTVRPVIEILTSFITLLDDQSYLDEDMINYGWSYKNYLSKNLSVGLPKNLHKIRKKITKKSKDPKTILSDYIIDKYSNDKWRMV